MRDIELNGGREKVERKTDERNMMFVCVLLLEMSVLCNSRLILNAVSVSISTSQNARDKK